MTTAEAGRLMLPMVTEAIKMGKQWKTHKRKDVLQMTLKSHREFDVKIGAHRWLLFVLFFQRSLVTEMTENKRLSPMPTIS